MIVTTPKIAVDKERYITCFTCEVACKQEHNLPVGSRWITVETVGPRMVGQSLRMEFVPTLCTHCGDPACA